MKFLDTNVLLRDWATIWKEPFYISSVSLRELERIKMDKIHKDPETRFQARKAIHVISEHPDMCKVIVYHNSWDTDILETFDCELNDDARIMMTAKMCEENITFITNDISCRTIAENVFHLNTVYSEDENNDNYTGYKIITLDTDEKMCEFYSNMYDDHDLCLNEYLLISDGEKIIDKYKYIEDNKIITVPFQCFDTKHFGKVKPFDEYQLCAIDSLRHNRISVLRGPAGAGKSLLAMSCLFDKLENNEISRIVIFCNTVATADSAKLGYYPGDKDEKLLDSQIGNFLITKLGAKEEVIRLIDHGQLWLLPMSDIRGLDLTGMNAGVYITEAQNMTIELARLCLQRVGEDGFVILDGDDAGQVDMNIYAGDNNGLRRASEVFRGHDIYGEVKLVNNYRDEIGRLAQLM